MVYFLGLSASMILGFGLGVMLTNLKFQKENDLLRRSLSYWRSHRLSRFGMSYRTFDPDIYDDD